VRDPRLGAVDHPAVAVAHGLRAERRGVAAGLGLGERERAEDLAARHRLEVALLERLAPVREQHLRGERVVHAHQHRGARVGHGHLLEREQVARGVEREAVVRLGEEHAEEAGLAEPRHERRLEVLVAVPFGGERRDVLGGERAGEVADLALGVGERQDVVEHGLLLVRVEAAPRLAAEPTGGHVLLEQRAGRYLGSPRPSCMTSRMATQVSRPMKSASVSGPMGWFMPSFITVSIASGVPTPSITQYTASLIIGMRTRLATKPG
jgi:hypothetical protein